MRHLVAYITLGLSVFVLDRISKYMALHMQHPWPIHSLLTIEPVTNHGMSWGLLHHYAISPIFLAIGIAGILVWSLYMLLHTHISRWRIYACILIGIGGISNIIDRLLYAGVIDFLHLHWGSWSWPIFNIADIAIVVGVGMLVWQDMRS